MNEVATISRRLDVTPAAVARVEAALLQLPQADCPVRHHFAPGVCIREVRMPAGAIVIGHAHRFADLNQVVSGRLTLLNADGSTREVSGPLTFLGEPGRKIAYVHEDTVWQNIFPTGDLPADQRTDVGAIEAHFLDKSPEWQADRAQRLALDRLARSGDREDFAAFLTAFELPAEEVRQISENGADQMLMPVGEWKFQIGESAIEGRGVLATAEIAPGEVIGPARIEGKRTPLGRYTNHAADPNAMMMPGTSEWEIILVAIRPIRGCAGGQPGEEITVNYAQVLTVTAKTKGKICQP